MTNHSSPANAAPPADLSERIRLYLDDAPSTGGHSDAAGANCWELLQEAMGELRIRAQCARWPSDGEMLNLLIAAGYDDNEVHPACYRGFGWKTFTEKLRAYAFTSPERT